jgi:16S rRNA (adenine1518-N6/adenine1519-N6)-dimethyltransferase
MNKRLGQHFLNNPAAAEKLAGSLDLQAGDTVIEIGPGNGALTRHIAKRLARGARLVAIEKDPALAETISRAFPEAAVIAGDALETLPRAVRDARGVPYKLCGNIPYYITGHLFRVISDLEFKPARAAFMVQEEVAERITAAPPRMNRLAASIQVWAEPKIIMRLKPSDFTPPPAVRSAIIALEVKHDAVAGPELQAYYAAVQALFRQPRKTILNNLKDAFEAPKEEIAAHLTSLGIPKTARPGVLSVNNINAISIIPKKLYAEPH